MFHLRKCYLSDFVRSSKHRSWSQEFIDGSISIRYSRLSKRLKFLSLNLNILRPRDWQKETTFLSLMKCSTCSLNSDPISINWPFVNCIIVTGSLPPSPADSGVSDVDSSSSGGQPACSEELKARLGMPPHCPPQGHMAPGTFLHPNFYHNSPPQLRNIWNNRNVSREFPNTFFFCYLNMLLLKMPSIFPYPLCPHTQYKTENSCIFPLLGQGVSPLLEME